MSLNVVAKRHIMIGSAGVLVAPQAGHFITDPFEEGTAMPHQASLADPARQSFKQCRKCGVDKAVSEFYAHRGSKAPRDGLQSYCKKCCSATSMERAKTPDGQAYYRGWKSKWLKTPKGKESQKTNARRYKAANPLKTKARKLTNLAVEFGVLVRPGTCSACGAVGKNYENGRFSIEAHHPDHSKPLDVIWLCMPCHRQADKEVANAS